MSDLHGGSLIQELQRVTAERDALRVELEAAHESRDAYKAEIERTDRSNDILTVAEDRDRLKDALDRINKVGLDRSLGQIVGSEHYEKAWLDCVEIAGKALFPPSSEKGNSRG